jgi:hypothetical protein
VDREARPLLEEVEHRAGGTEEHDLTKAGPGEHAVHRRHGTGGSDAAVAAMFLFSEPLSASAIRA